MKLAVLLPCYNEETAIAGVIADFQAALPGAAIYVYDNNSSDETAAVARGAGAIVRNEPRQGKGNVVRRMFADIEADAYILADGDGTYDASVANDMVAALRENNADMIVATREKDSGDKLYRPGHRFGNKVFNSIVKILFGEGVTDMLSGYRVMSNRFVKSFPALSQGFEIETELTIHALQLRMPLLEKPTRYFDRAEGSESKLSTYKDGLRILSFILFVFKDVRPFIFFGLFAVLLGLLSIGVATPIILDYLDTGLVVRFPTAFLSLGIMLCAVISFVCGIILDSVCRGRVEQKRLRYLSFPSVQEQS